MRLMFGGLMVTTWEAGTVAAVVAGIVGVFVVLRGASFAAHAVPQSAFAGAAGAGLLGIDPLVGLGVFALGSALGIGFLSRRGRPDVATALALVTTLGLGALFLSWSTEYAQGLSSLLFGQIVGVSRGEVGVLVVLGTVAVVVLAVVARRLLLTSVEPELARARGVDTFRLELVFLVVVALVATMAVPIVGALLVFSLLVGPPAAARCLVDRPGATVGLSVALALGTVWVSIAAAYSTDWPVGFFVGTVGAALYASARLVVAARSRWRPRGGADRRRPDVPFAAAVR
jgi:zinc/manganese transport system permease protein